MAHPPKLPTAIVAACLVLAETVSGASFTISSASSSAQTLGGGSGQTGTITSAGTLTVSGATVAVTITGSSATLANSGMIIQTGTGRAIRDNTGVTNLLVTNDLGALMQTADADVIQMNKTPASVTLNNYGTMTSLNASKGGAQAVDFNAILSGSNIINNYSTGIMQAADADGVRPGVGGIVFNAGTMKATTSSGLSVAGINTVNNSAVQITNDITGLVEGAHHGITGGALDSTVIFTMSVTNNAGGIIRGSDGSGIHIGGFNANETVTIFNNGTITGNGVTGDGDGVDVDGLVNLTNTGTIRSLNSFSATTSAQSEGVTIGGGTIVNSGTIEGDVAAGNTNATGRGITVSGLNLTGTADPIYGNTTITNKNGGMITGKTSGIVVAGGASGFAVTITNEAGGTIQGSGSNAAALRTGADNDTINNFGLIRAVNSGKAIDMGAGNNTLNILGGAASVIGDISGGIGGSNAMTINPGTGNSFTYAGSISNFNSLEIKSSTVTLTGTNSYSGTTSVEGGTLSLSGAGAITSAVTVKSGAAFQHSGSIGGNATGVTVQTGGSYYVTAPAVSGLASFSGSGQYLALQSGSNVLIDIGAPARGAGYDYIIGLQTLTLPNSGAPAHFLLNYLGSYSPAAGDTFDFLDWNTGPLPPDSLFDFTAAPAGFTWDTGNFLSNGQITLAVPEPETASLFMLGVFGMICRRKRRV